MEINTSIAEDIQATDQNAQYDAACKRLLSERIILAWIMKSCLKEYRGCDVKEIAEKYIESEPEISKVFVAPDETNAPTKIRGIGNEDNSLTEGRITYDIRFLASVPGSGELIQMIVNVEIQGKFYPGYPVVTRGIYYGCRMISSQYGTEFTHSEYQNIKQVHEAVKRLNTEKEPLVATKAAGGSSFCAAYPKKFLRLLALSWVRASQGKPLGSEPAVVNPRGSAV